MAFADTQSTTPVLHILAAPFVAIGNLLMRIASASSLARKVEQLNAMSDEELHARGTSRQAETQKLFRGYMMI